MGMLTAVSSYSNTGSIRQHKIILNPLLENCQHLSQRLLAVALPNDIIEFWLLTKLKQCGIWFSSVEDFVAGRFGAAEVCCFSVWLVRSVSQMLLKTPESQFRSLPLVACSNMCCHLTYKNTAMKLWSFQKSLSCLLKLWADPRSIARGLQNRKTKWLSQAETKGISFTRRGCSTCCLP